MKFDFPPTALPLTPASYKMTSGSKENQVRKWKTTFKFIDFVAHQRAADGTLTARYTTSQSLYADLWFYQFKNDGCFLVSYRRQMKNKSHSMNK